MPYNKEQDKEVIEQVNIQEVLRRHNLGRFELILVATKVARYEDIRPHDALKKMLEIEDMDVYFKEAKEKQIKAEFNNKF
jgi:hypothetical protein